MQKKEKNLLFNQHVLKHVTEYLGVYKQTRRCVFAAMSLRRFAQENSAGLTGTVCQSSSQTPKSPLVNTPTTPRNRSSIGVYHSPTASTSSASRELVRGRRAPTYGTPQNRARKAADFLSGSGTPARKAIIRKKSLLER